MMFLRRACWVLLIVIPVGLTAQSPTFFARQDYPIGGSAKTADVNNDGILDIITSSFQRTISVLIGKGDGIFQISHSTSFAFVMNDFAALDLNGDGYADILMTGNSGLGVCFGNGDGTFQPLIEYEGGDGHLGQLVVGDFTEDGIPDVISVGTAGIWLWVGTKAGSFNAAILIPASGFDAPGVVAADLNGDGHLDLAITIYTIPGDAAAGGFAVSFGNGKGSFQAPVIYASKPSGAHFIAIGDFNLDGRPDVALLPQIPGYTSAYIYENTGAGTFTRIANVQMNANSRITVGDVNGDHIPDLVNEAGTIAYGLGNFKFKPAVSYPIQTSGPGTGFAMPVISSLRNNGLMDIVFGELDATSVLLNNGNGKLKDGIWISVPGSGNCAADGDFNRDGHPDLAIPTANGITILLGTGKATAPYKSASTIPVSGPGCPIAGDVNGDGIPDLLFGADSAGGVAAYLGNGDGTFRNGGITPANPGVLVLGDFNHDGKPDFADSSNEMALGNGDGTFGSTVSIVASPPLEGFSWIVAGDLNNDGWTDLILTNWNVTRSLYVLINNHKQGYRESLIQNTQGPLALVLADLNGDGNLDAVVELYYAYYVAVYLGDGAGGFDLSGTVMYQGSNLLPPAVKDINGDGIPDLVLPSDGSLLLVLGNGDGTFAPGTAQGVGPGAGQILFQALHGQNVNLPDIVSPDSTGGITVLINTTR